MSFPLDLGPARKAILKSIFVVALSGHVEKYEV